jgi:hypothetical protein
LHVVSVLALGLILATCKGDMGDPGAVGPMGTSGTNGTTGPTGPTGPAGPSGFGDLTVLSTTALTTTTVNIATVTLVAPQAGFVVLTGNGVFQISHVTGTDTFMRVFLTSTSGFADFNNLTFFEENSAAPTGSYAAPFSITRSFAVAAGSVTLYMTANTFSGAGSIVRHNLTAVFFPSRL